MLPKYLKPYHVNFSNLIRIGKKSDGGYVIDKRVISKTKAVITCGLEDEWSFEKEFQKYNKECKIIAFDHTVNKNFWIKNLINSFFSIILLKQLNKKTFLKLFKFIEYKFFFNGKNIHHIKKIVSKQKNQNKEITINKAIGDNKDIILKIDIEEDEYKILKDVNKNFDKINLVIIEFHNLQKNLKKIKKFIKKTKLKNIHINANNYGMVDNYGIPQVIEMTLINSKKFKIKSKKTKRNYPIKGLDFKNRERGRDIKIVFDK